MDDRTKKNRTEMAIRKYAKGKSINRVKDVSLEILKSNHSDPIIRGELCECLLVLMLEDFIKKNNLNDWIISKGLILKDLSNPNSPYYTELDVTLFTPKRVYLFECKSYRGKKKLDDKCTLYVKSQDKWFKRVDVFSQHIKHYKALYRYIKAFRLKSDDEVKPVKIAMFDFSIEDVKDVREEKYKRLMPVLNERTLLNLFEDYNSLPNQWDIKYVRKVVEKLESYKEGLTTRHLKYVTNLHSSDRDK